MDEFFLYLILIIILLGIGGFVAYQRFLQPSGETETAVEATPVPDLVDIVIVTQNVQVGQVLQDDVLGVISIPRGKEIPEMFTDLGAVVGRRAKYDLMSGVILTSSMIVNEASELPDRGSVAASSIPKGKVALAIPINRLSSVAYALKSGDKVIVIASMSFVDLDSEFQSLLPNSLALIYGPMTSLEEGTEVVTGAETDGEGGIIPIISAQAVSGDGTPIGRVVEDEDLEEMFYIIPSEPQRARLATHIIIPRAEVLYMGEFPLAEEEEILHAVPTPTPLPEEAQVGVEEGVQEEEPAEPKPPDLVTLIVTPQEAVNLTYLLNSGVDLTLALRSAGDETVIDTKTVTMQYFLDDYSIPVPAKLPYGFSPRLDEVELPVEVEPTPTPVP
ncbi:MAG: hypothetical protein MAG431_00314 [Chloroflexi bacterium]|nr:hypothetical protein [Chloroflexota bacterium]